MTAQVLAFADKKRLAYVGSLPGKDEAASDAWFTPVKYIEAARTAFGSNGIQFDPFSSHKANETVKAVEFCDGTEGRDGFDCRNWVGNNIWINPPYSRGNMQKAVDAVIDRLTATKNGKLVYPNTKIILLCNNASDTRWWTQLVAHSVGLCLTDHRIQFNQFDGKSSQGNTRGQAFFALGNLTPDKSKRFYRKFNECFEPFAASKHVWRGPKLEGTK